jgi:hypothetical protein
VSDKNTRWEVYVEREDFERFREDEEIAALLNLARVVNMLNFCHHALLELPKGDTPASSRALSSGLFLSAGLLYEGLHVAQTMGKYFRGRESYKTGFAKLMGDERMKRFRSTGLARLRNEAAFHFNDEIAPAILKKLNLPEYKFLTGEGPKSGNIYYNLADEVLHNHLIGYSASAQEGEAEYKKLLGELAYVITPFVEAARALIQEVLLEKGWQVRETDT